MALRYPTKAIVESTVMSAVTNRQLDERPSLGTEPLPGYHHSRYLVPSSAVPCAFE